MPTNNPDYNSSILGSDMDLAFYKVLHPDTEPTDNSSNLVTSGAVKKLVDDTAEEIVSSISQKKAEITLTTSWTNSDDIYSQIVTLQDEQITSNTKIDIQLTAAQIASLYEDEVIAMTIENNNGTITCYSIGAAPSSQMTVQVILTEVSSS